MRILPPECGAPLTIRRNILNLSQADSFPSSSSGPIGGFGALGASGGGHGGAGLQPARAVKVSFPDLRCPGGADGTSRILLSLPSDGR